MVYCKNQVSETLKDRSTLKNCLTVVQYFTSKSPHGKLNVRLKNKQTNFQLLIM